MREDTRTIKKYVAQSWCLKHDIIIYAVPVSRTTVRIIVLKQGEPIPGKKVFDAKGGKTPEETWWDVVYQLYEWYYDQDNPD